MVSTLEAAGFRPKGGVPLNGGFGYDPLAPGGAAGFSVNGGLRSLALNRMKETMLAQLEKESAVNIDKYQAKFDEYQASAQRFRVAEGRLSLATMSIQGNLENISKIKDHLFDMKVAVETAATTTDSNYIAKVFDTALSGVNREADALPKLSNLIGNNGQTVWSTPEISVRTDNIGTRTTINGQYLGSDFYITDMNGDTWVPSWGARTVERYTDFPSKTRADTENYSLDGNSFQLNSLSAGAIDFTVYPNNAAKTATYTGTVTTGGLDVMPSFMYDDFTTTAQRTLATTDVGTARDAVSSYEAQLKSELARIESYQGQLNTTIEQYNDLSIQAATEGLYSKAKSEYDMQLRYQGVVANLQSMAQTQGQYGKIFRGALQGNKMAGVMIDRLA